jgi:hypothetical protein
MQASICVAAQARASGSLELESARRQRQPCFPLFAAVPAVRNQRFSKQIVSGVILCG